MALLELLIALTLTGEVQHTEVTPSRSSTSDSQTVSTNKTSGQNSLNIQLKARTDYQICEPTDADEAHDSSQLQGQTSYENALSGMFAQPDNGISKKCYLKEIGQNVGCPYFSYAQYLTSCRPDKRKSAWKRIVREDSLYFDRKGMRQFEAISRKYAFL